MTTENKEQSDDSSDSLAKRGTLAATALALGAGATAGTAAAQDDEDVVVVFEDDYRPDADFDVVSELEPETKEDVLSDSGATDDVFDDPDDWDAYIIKYDLDTDAPAWGLLFTEDIALEAGDSETMGEEGAFRDSRLNMIEAEL